MGIAERKERKKAELRELILVAAREIVLEHGFEALSMRKIAEAIEYSAATIYLHFESRDALAFELVREGFAEMLAAVAPVAAIAEPLERLREIARRYVAFGIENPQTYRLIFMEDSNFSDGIISAQLDAPNEPSTMAFGMLQTTVDELIAKRIFRAADSETISQMLWAITGCAPSRAEAQKPPARAPVAIVVERAGAPAARALFTGPGSVSATHTYRIAFEIPGRVTSVAADVGDRVGAGETLAAIDDADYRAQLASARARAASAAANALRAQDGARPQERAQAGDAVAAARASMARSQSAVALAARNDARDRTLLASGFVAAQAADTAHVAFVDAENQLSVARAQVASAEHNRALVDAGPRDEDRTAAFADADAARANASLAQTTYAKTTIHAPVDAYVLSRDIELGRRPASSRSCSPTPHRPRCASTCPNGTRANSHREKSRA